MKQRKGQFFIITAVIVVSILFLLSQLLLDAADIPISEVENDPAPATHQSVKTMMHEAWWNGSFESRRQLETVEETGYVLHNYAQKETVTGLGEMEGDCSDLRVTENEDAAPFFIVDCSSDRATIWFQHDLDADATETDAAVYYEDNAETTPVNGAWPRKDVFIHFEDSDAVSGEWSESPANNWETVSTGDGDVYRSTDTGTGDTWTLFNETGETVTYRDAFRVTTDFNVSGGANAGIQFWHNTSQAWWMANLSDTGSGLDVSLTENDTGSFTVHSTAATGCSTGTWCNLSVSVFNETVTVRVDGDQKIEEDLSTDGNDQGFTGLHGHGGADNQVFDNVTIRYFVDPEPAVTVQEEEAYSNVIDRVTFFVETAAEKEAYRVSTETGNCTDLVIDSFAYRITETVC